jgi:hypothetical protein
MVPKFMGSGANTRLPVTYRATISNLTPNAVYQFRTTLGIATDLNTANNTAGNPLFLNNPNAVVYTSSQSLQAGRSGQFTTDAAGSYTGWFAVVNTGNSRFTAGNEIYPVLSLNGGTGAAGDSTVQKRVALDQTIHVLRYSTSDSADRGTGIYGASQAPAKSFVALYDNEAGTGRPIAVTPVQALGVTIASLATFYSANVSGNNGSWGAIVPNDLANGVRRIANYDGLTGAELAANTSATGTWGATNTVNPRGSTTAPLVISATDAPLITGLLKSVNRPILSVSPNPSSRHVEVKGLAAGETVDVLDILGSKQAVRADAFGVINISSLRAGAYFVSTSKGKVARFVKTN